MGITNKAIALRKAREAAKLESAERSEDATSEETATPEVPEEQQRSPGPPPAPTPVEPDLSDAPRLHIQDLGKDELKVTLAIVNKSYSDNIVSPNRRWYCRFLMKAAKELEEG